MTNPIYIFAGSWNPLHQHHLDIANHVEQKYNTTVIFELCKNPFDKEPLSDEEIRKRVNQFIILNRDYVVTDNTTFTQRARHRYYDNSFLAPRIFMVGFDTIVRVDDPKYYFGSESEKNRCLKYISRNCRFLVFNRGESDKTKLSKEILDICDFSNFRTNDISSTKIRNNEVNNEKSKFTNLEEKESDKCLIEHLHFGSCFIYNKSLYKLIYTITNPLSPHTELVFNGEEFIPFSWGTEVYKTNIKAWEYIK